MGKRQNVGFNSPGAAGCAVRAGRAAQGLSPMSAPQPGLEHWVCMAGLAGLGLALVPSGHARASQRICHVLCCSFVTNKPQRPGQSGSALESSTVLEFGKMQKCNQLLHNR